jgi:hypothetical protein
MACYSSHYCNFAPLTYTYSSSPRNLSISSVTMPSPVQSGFHLPLLPDFHFFRYYSIKYGPYSQPTRHQQPTWPASAAISSCCCCFNWLYTYYNNPNNNQPLQQRQLRPTWPASADISATLHHQRALQVSATSLLAPSLCRLPSKVVFICRCCQISTFPIYNIKLQNTLGSYEMI